MSRNNEDRLTPTTGASQDAATETPPPTNVNTESEASSNGGASFSFVTPTEFVELPSKGEFYPEGHPLHGVETIEIRHMTAKDEDILTSKTLLKKGVALDRMIKNLMIDKRIDPEGMLVGDKNAIIVSARKSGYGSDYETNVQCPNCGTTNQTVFDLDEIELTDVMMYQQLDSVERQGQYFVIDLPRSMVKVKVRLLTGVDEQRQARNQRMAKKNGVNVEQTLTSQFRNFIVAVNEDTSQRTIANFVDNMPAADSRFLRTIYKTITPNVDMNMLFECNTCDYDSTMEVPFTADFFWPK